MRVQFRTHLTGINDYVLDFFSVVCSRDCYSLATKVAGEKETMKLLRIFFIFTIGSLCAEEIKAEKDLAVTLEGPCCNIGPEESRIERGHIGDIERPIQMPEVFSESEAESE